MNNHITFNKTSKRIFGLKTKTLASIVIIILITTISLFLTWFVQASLAQTFDVGQSNYTAPKHPENSQYDQIHSYIEEVFGKYAPQAFIVLQGTKGSKCAENRGLVPNAVHRNDDGTADWGLFQWNDYWNGFNKEVNNKKYLFDYKVATQLAYRKFVDDGYSFHAWTCGAYYERLGWL